MHIGLLFWSILPGILWAHWLYKRDAFQPEPLGLVLRAFIIGMLLTAPAIFFSSHIRGLPSLDPSLVETDWIWAFKTSFLVASSGVAVWCGWCGAVASSGAAVRCGGFVRQCGAAAPPDEAIAPPSKTIAP